MRGLYLEASQNIFNFNVIEDMTDVWFTTTKPGQALQRNSLLSY